MAPFRSAVLSLPTKTAAGLGSIRPGPTPRYKELENEASELMKMLADERLKNRVLE